MNFKGVFYNFPDKELQSKIIEEMLNHEVGEYLSDSIRSEVIDHPLDITYNQEKSDFLFAGIESSYLLNYELPLEESTIEIAIPMGEGVLNQQYIQKLAFFYNLPRMQVNLQLNFNGKKYEFVSEDLDLEDKLNRNKDLFKYLSKFIIPKLDLHGYKLINEESIATFHPNEKDSEIMLATLPFLHKNETASLNAEPVFKIINEILKVL